MTFSEVLKDIRAQQHYTQEKLARELNVSFSTINRWENNKTTPSELAKMHIIEYCNKNMIDKRTIDLLLKIEWTQFIMPERGKYGTSRFVKKII